MTNNCLIYPVKKDQLSKLNVKIDQKNQNSKNLSIFFTLKTSKNPEFLKKIIDQNKTIDDKKKV